MNDKNKAAEAVKLFVDSAIFAMNHLAKQKEIFIINLITQKLKSIPPKLLKSG